MKKASLTCILLIITLFANAQIKVEENPPQKTSPTQTSVTIFDSTTNKTPKFRKKSSYIGKELFFLGYGGDFYIDSLAENRISTNPKLSYFIVLDEIFLPGREYYDSYKKDFVKIKSKHIYKLNEKGTDIILYFYPNSSLTNEDVFDNGEVIWVSYYNYLKTEYIGKKYVLTRQSYTDYNTGNPITYKYNDIWTVEEIKVIKMQYGREYYQLRLVLKNNNGNTITLPLFRDWAKQLLVDKKSYDGYVKRFGTTMVKNALEGEVKVGMHKDLVQIIAQQYEKNAISITRTSKGEEWTINAGSKTKHINFNNAGKVTSWKEEDTQVLQIKGKVSVSPR